MKRYGNLWDKFISEDNWKSAFKNALKGKKKTKSLARMKAMPEDYYNTLRKQVIDGTFKFNGYRVKTIYEPKERKIYVARYEERVLHWAVIQVIEPIFEKTFITDSYACRKGKGQHKAVTKCNECVRKYKYCLKCDIRKFYPSINKERLMWTLEKKIKDKKLLSIIQKIIDTYTDPDTGTGIPIGNYTSQVFGNIYLNELDQFCKHYLKAPYIRYCDDFLLFSNDKDQIRDWKDKIYRKVDTMKFLLSRCEVLNTCQGIDFVGYRSFGDFVLVRKRTVTRFKRRLKRFIDEQVIASIKGWLSKCNSFNLQRILGLC